MMASMQANIILTALTSKTHPTQRYLNLNPQNKSINIGRASKSLSKGLVAASDNAWFDSAVMSRDHACLRFDSESKVLYIQDKASMHGTRVNGQPITSYDQVPLSNDSIICFGSEVRRAHEVFPACRFRINYTLDPWTATASSTFRVPSDFEDDDSDVDISEDEGDDRNEDRDDHTPVESPEVQVMKVCPTPAMIDLTGKDDEVGEVAYHEKESCHSDAPRECHPGDAKVFEATPESDDESIDSSNFGDGGDDGPDQYFGDDADDSDVPSEQPICRGISIDLCEEAGRDSSEEPLDRPDATEDDGSCALDSDEYDGASLWSDFEEERDGRDVFISEVPQPTNMSRQQQEIDPKDAEPSQPEPTKIGAEDRYPTPERLVPQLFVKQPSFADEMDQELSVAPSRILSMPNPSDAVMAKSLTPRANSSEAIFSEVSEKSNKHEFFAARAENRARLQFGQPIQLCSDIDDFFQGPSFTEDIAPLKQTPSAASQMSERRSIMLADYLFGPDRAPRQASADLDMTSAATFAQSKAAQTSYESSSPTQQNRRSVTIKDIVEDAEAVIPEQPQPLKRKAADISDLVEGEIDLWSQKETQSATETIQPSQIVKNAEPVREKTEERVVDAMTEPVAQVPEPIIDIPVPAKQATESRPSKRLKRFAEAVGYAALGGVVAGAGLFAALVSTAPDF